MTAFTRDDPRSLEDQILALKQEKNALILAHYYQDDDIQDIADYIGDSLDLSRKSAAADADVIVFCGVRFMADVAKILNPTRTVLLPDINAGCSLEDSCPPKEFKAFVNAHPDHTVLTYINSSAEVKGLSDIIVTSSNAEAIIRSIPEDQPIIFGPDRFLGGYLSKKTGRDMLLWQGSCIVHEQFSEQELLKLQAQHPAAYTIAHPECPDHLLRHAGFVGSTSKLVAFAADHNGKEIIVLTESGIFREMRRVAPDARLIAVPGIGDDQGSCSNCARCPYMRLNTLEKLRDCLRDGTPEILMTEHIRAQAEKPLLRMLELSV